MTQDSRQAEQRSRGATTRSAKSGNALMRAKMEFVAARERGESGAMVRMLAAYPQHAFELTEFDAGLTATTSYEHEPLTPAIEGIALRARERAFALLFPQPAEAQPVAAQAVAAQAASVSQRVFSSLKELRQARRIGPVAAAKQLGIGVDVLTNIEHGRVRVATIPERLLQRLGEVLSTTTEQVRLTLQNQVSIVPAFNRGTGGASAEPELDFAQAVRLSPSMSAEEKAAWLEA